MNQHGWNRKQVSKHFGVWYRLGEGSNRTLERSKDDILASLKAKCGSANEIMNRTRASHDVEVPLNRFESLAVAKAKMDDLTIWTPWL